MGSTAMYECGCFISRSILGDRAYIQVQPCPGHAEGDPGVQAALVALAEAIRDAVDAESSEQLVFGSGGFEKKEKK